MRKKDFPLLQKGLIYLDTAATAQKPKVVIDKIHDFYTNDYATVHRGIYEISRRASHSYHRARLTVQSFLGASFYEEIIFTRGTTASLNLVARSFSNAFSLDTILLSEIEHHSNLVPWQMVAKEKGLKLKFIPVNDRGEIILEEYERLLKENRVSLVSMAHISNSIGTHHPVEKMVEMAHRYGAKFCLDAAQSAGHLPIDVKALDVDFFAASGHKMYGPTGIGILYGKKELLDQMPPIEGGGDMIESVSNVETSFGKAPLKFEAGTPMIAEVITLAEALDYLTAIGLKKIEAYEESLTNYALKRFEEIEGIKIVGKSDKRGPIISFCHDRMHPLDMGTLLDCKNIAIRTGHHCSQSTMQRFRITSTARISFGLYNTPQDIDILVEALKKMA